MSSTLTNLICHVVFSTKGRLNLVAPDFKEDPYAYICGIIISREIHMGLNSSVPSGRVHLHPKVPGVETSGLYKTSSLRDLICVIFSFEGSTLFAIVAKHKIFCASIAFSWQGMQFFSSRMRRWFHSLGFQSGG